MPLNNTTNIAKMFFCFFAVMNLTLQAWSCVYNTSPPVFIIENGSIGFTSLKYVYIALLLFICSSHVYIWLQSGKYKLCNKCSESKYSVYRANPNRVIIHRHLNCFCSFLFFYIFFTLLLFLVAFLFYLACGQAWRRNALN